MSRTPRAGVQVCELHHVVPLSQGGFHVKSNVQLLCRHCHVKMHKRERVLTMSPDRQAWAEYLQTY